MEKEKRGSTKKENATQAFQRVKNSNRTRKE